MKNSDYAKIDSEILKRQIKLHYDQLGILDLIDKRGVTEIVINGPDAVFFEQDSVWNHVKIKNDDSNIIIKGLGELLINNSGLTQKFDTNNPMLSITLEDGQRLQLVIKPAADEASLTLRIPAHKSFSMQDYREAGLFNKVRKTGGLSEQDAELKELLAKENYEEFLEKAVKYRKNIVVSGATGSGKTTFMKTLINLIDKEERIITIEDARELFFDHPNKVHLKYPKSKSESTVTAKSCLEATLRMRPDRIILAEVRGDEAYYFVRACGNGHSGSITSCHADSELMAYDQLAMMIASSAEVANLSYEVIRHLILMTIDISIHFANIHGERFITGIDFEPERKMKLLKNR